MTFTDDDLKRLKDSSPKNRYYLTFEKEQALLARLEAAERYVEEMKNSYCPTYKAWRKAAGKD